MRNLSEVADKEAAAAEAKARKELESQEIDETLAEATSGEHLPEDFELVAADTGRTFSQDEVNDIVRDRLAKERVRYNDAVAVMSKRLEEIKSALDAREIELNQTQLRYEAICEINERGFKDIDIEDILSLVMANDKNEIMRRLDIVEEFLHSQPPEASARQNGRDQTLRNLMGLHDLK